MNIFRSLRSLFGPKRDRSDRRGPLALLTTAHKNAILRLQQTEEWGIFLSALDAYVQLRAEALLVPTAEEVDFWRGYVAGLKAAAALPEQMAKQEEQRDVRDRRAERAVADSAARRAVATYSTPAWNGRGAGVGQRKDERTVGSGNG